MRRLALGLALSLCTSPPLLALQAKTIEGRLAEAVGLVDGGDFEAAIPALEKVVQQLSGDRARSKEQARAYLYLAIAYLGLSQEAAAKAKFVDAITHDKDLNLNPRDFPPKIISYFEQARREAGGRPGASSAARAPAALVPLFFEAVRAGNFATVSQMVKENPALAREKDAEFGATPLHWAALRGHEAIVGLLVAQGADVRATNRSGETPLQVAQRGKKDEIVKLLAPTSSSGIFDAARTGDIGRVRMLLDADPSLLNARDPQFGATPLHWAALRGNTVVVSFLVAAGADAKATNGVGETPFKVAQRAGRAEVMQILDPASSTRPTMGTKDSAVNPVNPDIFEAARSGDIAKARSLLQEQPTLISARDPEFGATPLHWAALRGQTGMVSFLLSAGADPNVKNKTGETALRVAERAGKSDVVRLLKPVTGS